MRNRLTVGDVFEVRLDISSVGFFQYVARDSSQLNSHIVRVFKQKHGDDEPRNVSQIVNGEIDFHAHVFLSVGVKQNVWRKIAGGDVIGGLDVMFRDSNDYGRSKRRTSNDWYVWSVDSPYQQVGALRGGYRNAEVGVVVPPDSLVYRMKNGSYDFFYPEPES